VAYYSVLKTSFPVEPTLIGSARVKWENNHLSGHTHQLCVQLSQKHISSLNVSSILIFQPSPKSVQVDNGLQIHTT
jgi:hypothetical protein